MAMGLLDFAPTFKQAQRRSMLASWVWDAAAEVVATLPCGHESPPPTHSPHLLLIIGWNCSALKLGAHKH